MTDEELIALARKRWLELMDECNALMERLDDLDARQKKKRTWGSMALSSYRSDRYWEIGEKLKLAGTLLDAADELESGESEHADDLREWMMEYTGVTLH